MFTTVASTFFIKPQLLLLPNQHDSFSTILLALFFCLSFFVFLDCFLYCPLFFLFHNLFCVFDRGYQIHDDKYKQRNNDQREKNQRIGNKPYYRKIIVCFSSCGSKYFKRSRFITLLSEANI